jgi:deoxyribodipyrimidine photo-lyase
VGSDPREDRYFSIPKQGQTYDPEARYIKHWCPELADAAIPADVLLNPSRLDAAARQRFSLSEEAYPRPVVPLKFGGAPGNKKGGGGGGYSGGGRRGGGGGGGGGASGGGGRRTQPFKGPRRPQHRLQSAAWDVEG